MIIVLPVHHFLPQYNGGAEQYTLRLARWLQALGHQVEVVCIEAIECDSPDQVFAVHDMYEGISVWRLSLNLLNQRTHSHLDYNNELLGDWFAAYLRNRRPDLVHFQAGYLIGVAPLYATVAAGVPTALTLHDYWFLCPRVTLQRGDGTLCIQIPQAPAGCAWCQLLESRRYRAVDWITAGIAGRMAQRTSLQGRRETLADRRATVLAALALPDAVIAPSRFLAERVAPFIQPNRLHISRLGLDGVVPPHHPHTPQPGEMKIGFIGQIAPHKGVHLLIAAFRKLDTRGRLATLHIYGGFDTQASYAKHLRQLAGDDRRIYFHGRFDNDAVGKVLQSCDVLAVPSTWYEVGPLTISEAQAAGTPVVAAAIGNIVDIVRDGIDGLLFAAGDAADLARQLQRLSDDPNLLPALRANNILPRSTGDEMRQLAEIYRRIGVKV